MAPYLERRRSTASRNAPPKTYTVTRGRAIGSASGTDCLAAVVVADAAGPGEGFGGGVFEAPVFVLDEKAVRAFPISQDEIEKAVAVEIQNRDPAGVLARIRKSQLGSRIGEAPIPVVDEHEIRPGLVPDEQVEPVVVNVSAFVRSSAAPA